VDGISLHINGKLKGQSRMDNPEKQETQVTQDEEKQDKDKDTTQYTQTHSLFLSMFNHLLVSIGK
jgi:hypothetical protein